MNKNPYMSCALVLLIICLIVSLCELHKTREDADALQRENINMLIDRFNDEAATILKSHQIWYVLGKGTLSTEPNGNGHFVKFPVIEAFIKGRYQMVTDAWQFSFDAQNYGKKVRFIDVRQLPAKHRGYIVLGGRCVMQVVE